MGLLRRSRPRQSGDELDRMLDALVVPSFPGVVTQLLGMLRDDSNSATDLARVLETDPGLHIRVLRTVNAAEHGLTAKVESVSKAVALLGRSRLEAIVVSVAVKDALPHAPVPKFDETSFWKTAAKRAAAARALAARLHRGTADESFTVALLLDVGVPVLAAAHRQAYVDVYSRWKDESETDLATLELQAFGLDHQTVGARLVERWELPEVFARMIREHHGGGDAVRDVPGVRLAALLRDDEASDGSIAILSAGHTEHSLPPEETRALLDAAFRDAEELARALA